MQVHKETISTIPNSIPNRGDPEVEIYGMEGIPEKDMKERQQKGGSVGDGKKNYERLWNSRSDVCRSLMCCNHYKIGLLLKWNWCSFGQQGLLVIITYLVIVICQAIWGIIMSNF